MHRSTVLTYEVQSGDTLAALAADFKLSLNTLRWANSLSGDTLRVRQKLVIPPGDGIVYTAQKGDTLDAIALKYKITSRDIRSNNNL